METTIGVIAAVTAILIAAGTIFSAIYQSKSKSETILQDHIKKLDADMEKMRVDYGKLKEENETLHANYDNLFKLYEKEKGRSNRLEKKIRELSNKGI